MHSRPDSAKSSHEPASASRARAESEHSHHDHSRGIISATDHDDTTGHSPGPRVGSDKLECAGPPVLARAVTDLLVGLRNEHH